MAVPAKPWIRTVTQPNGTTLQVMLAGDEWHHSYLTADGYTIAKAADGNFYYKTTAGITNVPAHDKAVRNAQEAAFIAANKEQLSLASQFTDEKRQARAKAHGIAVPKGSQIPHINSPRIPVLLLNYKDKQFKDDDPVSVWQQQLAGTEGTTMYKYFYDQSFGKFTPQFDIYGPFDLSENRVEYGGNKGNGQDKGVGKMVAEGCLGLDSVINFSQYDNDGDAVCDVVIVVYAGDGEASSYDEDCDNAVWPCQWNLASSDYGQNLSLDEVLVSKFAVFNELYGSDLTMIDGIGTMCHEFSHCLGLPDFYDTNYANHYGMGSWSLLCRGCYNNDGFTPCGYTAYERTFMGWFEPSTPVSDSTYTIQSVAAGGEAFMITSDNPNEYYLIENIQQTEWNEYAAASGLMVTHVNYNWSWWNYNMVNNYNTQGMTIIPADGTLKMYQRGSYYFNDLTDEPGDLYPYDGNDELTSTSTPAATLYNSSENLDKPITGITRNDDGTVTFSYMKEPTPEPVSGDVNRDGYVTSADVTAIYDYLLNGDETFLDTSDVNGDGYITSADVTAIYDLLLN